MTIAMVIVLMAVGLGLLAIELLVIPGFGLIGLLGMGAIVGSGVLAFGQLGPAWGALSLGGGLLTGGLMFWLLPKTRAGQAMVLRETQKGGVAADKSLTELAGARGEAITPLRPAGSARLAGRVVDVVADGGWIDAGAAVQVVKVEGVRVVVEPVETP